MIEFVSWDDKDALLRLDRLADGEMMVEIIGLK